MFGVVPKLAKINILGTVFSNKEITIVKTKNLKILPKNGHAVTIVKSFENKDAVQALNDVKARKMSHAR